MAYGPRKCPQPLASTCNFTHAAKELGYSQSNVSAQIAQLEDEIGAQLFNRIGRRTSLTQFGEELLPYAQEICSAASKIDNLTRSEDSLRGTVRAGLTDSISELHPEDAFLAFHRRFPLVQLEIVLDTTEKLLERLRKGDLDTACLITDPLSPAEWVVWKEYHTPIIAVVNPSMPTAGKKSICVAELTRLNLVLMETNAPYSGQFELELARQHLDCRPVFRLQSPQAAIHIVEREKFAAVLPHYAVKAAEDSKTVSCLTISDWQHQQMIQSVLHRNKELTPQVTGFLEEINRILARILDQ
ncbi:MAG: LysR family transcriptional regulator [Oscillospiraceae bacterium]|nr:LysR family transcriptional regulator [Oscillospiraceae bacterium]MBR0392754.1 LysR family transcriptional regulator [Oscillospiraceae bacterium]